METLNGILGDELRDRNVFYTLPQVQVQVQNDAMARQSVPSLASEECCIPRLIHEFRYNGLRC